LLPQHGGGETALGNITQDSLTETQSVQIISVSGERDLIEGSSVDVVEQLSG
jgi:hypothetical protein